MQQKSSENLQQQADRITDPGTMELERKIGSDVAGARHEDISAEGVDRENNVQNGADEDVIFEEDVAFDASFVMNDPVIESSSEESDMVNRCLKSIKGLICVEGDHEDCDQVQNEHQNANGELGNSTASTRNENDENDEDEEREAESSLQDNPDYLSEDAYMEVLSRRWKADATSMRKKYPIKEFDFPEMLPMAFPTTFMMGTAYPKNPLF